MPQLRRQYQQASFVSSAHNDRRVSGGCRFQVVCVFVPGSVQNDPAVMACVDKLRADASKAHSTQKDT
jgi:hypothetical protein